MTREQEAFVAGVRFQQLIAVARNQTFGTNSKGDLCTTAVARKAKHEAVMLLRTWMAPLEEQPR